MVDAVGHDLGALRIPVFRHVVHLLEERHVGVRLDVAHGPRVAIPVPGAAWVGASSGFWVSRMEAV